MALVNRIDILMVVVMFWLPGQRLAPIKIEPGAPTVDVGQSTALRAVDESGQVVAVKWSISDPLVASISPQGVVTGRAAGRAVVRARSKNSRAETTVTVRGAERRESMMFPRSWGRRPSALNGAMGVRRSVG
jgi:hypothetical protein